MRNVYVLLAGLAVENLLKGEMVRQKPELVGGGMLAKEMKTHDLVKLASLAGLNTPTPLSPQESNLLEIASEACISWGRYPGGASSTKKGYIAPPDDLDLTSFRRVFESLFDRLEESVMEGIDDSWTDDLQ
jgi:hypothetical protein